MVNKKLLIKFSFVLFAFLLYGLSFTSAVTLNFNITGFSSSIGSVTGKMMYVHFADNGNDFGGFLYFSNLTGDSNWNDTGDLIGVRTSNTASKPFVCRTQLEGFYYNAERGERLWPLDENTKSSWGMNNLNLSGGIYYSCVVSGYQQALKNCETNTGYNYNSCLDYVRTQYKADGHGFYGYLSGNYGKQRFDLVVGVNYTGINSDNKFIDMLHNSDLSQTFVRLENKYPVGFIYDYNGGIGLVGCRIESGLTGGSMKNLIREFYGVSAEMSKIFLYSGNEIRYGGTALSGMLQCGGISLADTMSRIVVEGIVGMNDSTDAERTQFTTIGNSSDAKMQYFATKTVTHSAMINYIRKKAELLCRGKWKSSSWSSSDKIRCVNNMSSPDSLAAGYTRIIKNGSAKIEPNKGIYDIYLLSGDLLIQEDNMTGNKVFNSNGFVSNYTVQQFSGAAAGGNYNSGVAVGLFVKGNFVVNGHVKGYHTADPSDEKLKNKYFVYGRFTTKDTWNELEKVFAWRCIGGIGSDGNHCPQNEGNPYQNASLVIINQNYSSPLFGSKI